MSEVTIEDEAPSVPSDVKAIADDVAQQLFKGSRFQHSASSKIAKAILKGCAVERERCAQLCERMGEEDSLNWSMTDEEAGYARAGREIASAIRFSEGADNDRA